jgi:predicted lipoprotein
MSRAFQLVSLAVAFTGVCWLFPLFHVVTLKKATEEKAAATFNPTQFAETFWNDKLLKSLDQAVKVEELWPAIQSDPAAARKKYGRSLGLGDTYIYFVSGTGRVVAATDDEITLIVTEGAKQPEISLQVGLIFGNTVRDGTGLINVNDYPNSQDFNAISEELNRIVEARVLPKLREQAKVGALFHFVGCAEVDDEATDLKPLKVIPVEAEMQ